MAQRRRRVLAKRAEPVEQVLELLAHLTASGTGQSKLDALHQLGCTCEDADDFLEKANDLVPEGTRVKIRSFVGAEPPPPEPPPLISETDAARAPAPTEKEAEDSTPNSDESEE